MKKNNKVVFDIPIAELISTLQKIAKDTDFVDIEIIQTGTKCKLVLYPVKEIPPIDNKNISNPEITDDTSLYELF